MRRSAVLFALALLAAPPCAASAQPFPAGDSLNTAQKLGRDLFTGHCMVCHEHTQITGAAHFGPDISEKSLNGKDDALFAQISNGSPNMPGFKYVFNPDQMRAIVAYVKTLPVPTTGAPREGKASEGDRHDD